MKVISGFQKCDVVVHYAKAGDKFKFDVEADFSATGDVQDKWVGVGLSFDGGRGMGNDAAVACFVDSVGVDHVDNYWNVLDPAFFSYPVAVISKIVVLFLPKCCEEPFSLSFSIL